ncbi:MAG: hypothetical protein WCL70_02190 [Paludibacter sp.]
MKTIRFKLLFLSAFFCLILSAQENKTFPKVEEMHNRKWQFIVEKAKLTQAEADTGLPVFMEYEKALWAFHGKNGEFFRFNKDKLKDPNVNYSELNDRYVEMGMTQAQMFKNYHLKLRKILAPETLFRYYKAEREFKRELLKDLKDHPLREKRPHNQDTE